MAMTRSKSCQCERDHDRGAVKAEERWYGSRESGSARTPPASDSVNTPTGLFLSPSWWSVVQPRLPLCPDQERSRFHRSPCRVYSTMVESAERASSPYT